MALLDPVRRRARLDQEELVEAVELGGAVEPAWLARLLAPIAAPTLHAVAEVVVERRMVIVAQAWRSDRGCVLGRLGLDAMIDLCEIDAGMIPAALAVEVGLARRPEVVDRERLVVPLDQLSASPEEHLGAMYSSRMGSWRISAARPTAGSSVAVVDGGAEGLWVTEPAEDGGEPAIAFVPVSGDELAARLTGLFATP